MHPSVARTGGDASGLLPVILGSRQEDSVVLLRLAVRQYKLPPRVWRKRRTAASNQIVMDRYPNSVVFWDTIFSENG